MQEYLMQHPDKTPFDIDSVTWERVNALVPCAACAHRRDIGNSQRESFPVGHNAASN
jgi:hypothetical protein